VPNLYAIAATAVVPSLLSQTQGILSQYGLFGDLVHVGSVAVAFSAFVYVLHEEIQHPVNANTTDRLTMERTYLLDCYRRFRNSQ
jgi:oligosaccharide translocation protein RFT1